MFLAPRTKNKEYVGLLLRKARKDIIQIRSSDLEDSRKLRSGDGIGIMLIADHCPWLSQTASHSQEKRKLNR